MFRPLSRQIVKALPRSRILTSRPVHTMPVPYSGPPSYDTISRRFSSGPDPQAFFSHKRQQEAIDRGQFVDIHDIDPENGLYATDYDVSLTDITHQKLESSIAEELGIPYLSKAAEGDAKKVVSVADGYIYGLNNRSIVPLVVSHMGEARWVFFILDSGAPWTFLSSQACKLFGIEKTTEGATLVTIGGHHTPVRASPPRSHFADVNLLGTDICELHSVDVWQSYERCRVKLFFDKAGKLPWPE